MACYDEICDQIEDGIDLISEKVSPIALGYTARGVPIDVPGGDNGSSLIFIKKWIITDIILTTWTGRRINMHRQLVGFVKRSSELLLLGQTACKLCGYKTIEMQEEEIMQTADSQQNLEPAVIQTSRPDDAKHDSEESEEGEDEYDGDIHEHDEKKSDSEEGETINENKQQTHERMETNQHTQKKWLQQSIKRWMKNKTIVDVDKTPTATTTAPTREQQKVYYAVWSAKHFTIEEDLEEAIAHLTEDSKMEECTSDRA